MNRTAKRISFLQGCFALALALVVLRAGQLQLVEGSYWSEQAQSRRTARDTLEARRGSIYDRRGVQLAVTQEFYHVGIAPNEVADRRELVNVASRSLGVGAGELQRKLRTGKYMYFYGPYTATEIEPLRRLSGVHLEGSFRRDYPSSLAASVIGRLPPDSSRGGSGLERSLDNLLTGTPGEAVFLRDRVGRRLESPARKISDPVPATTSGSRSMPSCRTLPNASWRMRSGSWVPGAETSWCSIRGRASCSLWHHARQGWTRPHRARPRSPARSSRGPRRSSSPPRPCSSSTRWTAPFA